MRTGTVALEAIGIVVASMGLYKALAWKKTSDYFYDKYIKWKVDYGRLSEYREKDREVIREGRPVDLVLMGASITQAWRSEILPQGYRIVNRGVGGQTAAMELLRFQQDVVELRPKAVLIKVCSLNMNYGIPNEDTLGYVKAMSAVARANGIVPILALTLPISDRAEGRTRESAVEETRKIQEFNEDLRQFAAEKGFPVVDFFTPLVDGNGFLRSEFTKDGAHPLDEGYREMTKALAPVLTAVVGKN